MSELKAVTQETFQSHVLESDLPVIVDFWADWCAPCHRVQPILEDLASDYAGKVRVAKVNVDEEIELAGRYGIRSMPTFLVIQAGQVVDQISGARPKAEFEARFAALANPNKGA